MLAAKAALLDQQFGGARKLDLSVVWDGDGRNRNAALRAGVAIGSQQLEASALVSDADVEFDEGETAASNRSCLGAAGRVRKLACENCR